MQFCMCSELLEIVCMQKNKVQQHPMVVSIYSWTSLTNIFPPQILLTYPQTHSSTHHTTCMHFCTLSKQLLEILHIYMPKKKKQSPALSPGSKYPFTNIFCEKNFIPNPLNICPDTCQYLSWTKYPLLYIFKTLVNSAHVKKKKQSPQRVSIYPWTLSKKK